jgi:PhnB protein
VSTVLNPYLGFRDNARQAMEFYQSVFGAGNWTLSTFADFQASDDPAEQDKIMHGMLVTEGVGDHYRGSIKMPVDGASCG